MLGADFVKPIFKATFADATEQISQLFFISDFFKQEGNPSD
jgi:hypothetical protein